MIYGINLLYAIIKCKNKYTYRAWNQSSYDIQNKNVNGAVDLLQIMFEANHNEKNFKTNMENVL